MLEYFKQNANLKTERRLLVLLTFYGIIITLLHVVNFQTIFLIQPKTLQFIQKNSVYLGSRCFGCDDLIQNGYEKKDLQVILANKYIFLFSYFDIDIIQQIADALQKVYN